MHVRRARRRVSHFAPRKSAALLWKAARLEQALEQFGSPEIQALRIGDADRFCVEACCDAPATRFAGRMKLNCRRCGKGRPVWTQLCRNCVEQAIASLDWDAAFAELLGGAG
jgi:ribosomal protein S14